MKTRTSKVLAELRSLAAAAEQNLYQRIGLACEVMRDLDWIATVHGGSDLKAADALQSEYFRDLGGYVCLGKLMLMYEKVSQEEWQELRYNVAAVEVLYDDRTRETHEKGERTSWKKIAEERGDRIEDLERQVKQLLEANSRLQDENLSLRADVARMEGRMQEMERRTSPQLLMR